MELNSYRLSIYNSRIELRARSTLSYHEKGVAFRAMNIELFEPVIAELNSKLGLGRCNKIHQPRADLIVFTLWTGRETLALLLSAESAASRIHLTEQKWLNPSQPPRFCQLLRARIDRVKAISRIADDRVVRIDAHGRQGDAVLMAELTGRYSNLLLLDEQGRIIDALKRIQGPNVPRQLLPGKDYQLPIRSTPAAAGCASNRPEKPETLSWNQYVEKLYSNKPQSGGAGDLQQQLQKTVARQIKKLKKRQAHIEQDLQVQENAEQLKQAGDLLLANRWRLEKGLAALEVDNFYTESVDKITLSLDPLLTPQQNIDKYFQRYKKAKRGVEHSRRRLRETADELHWLEQLDYQLSETVKNSDSEEVAEELKSAGLWRNSSNLHARRTQPRSSFHETSSPSGFKVLWGRNNRQNDELSTSRLKAGDLWLHVHQAPGAHVVLKSGAHKQPVSEADVAFAAAIAAGYSKLRQDSKVEVMRAEADALSKPKGVRPGLVRVKQYTTLLVEPKRLEE